MTRRAKRLSQSIGLRLEPATWQIIAALAHKRGTNRGEEVRILIGEALAARRDARGLDEMEWKIDRILAFVMREEEAQEDSINYVKEVLRKQIGLKDGE